MKTRKCLAALVAAAVFAACCPVANAEAIPPIQPLASEQFTSYSAILTQGSGSGQLNITYSVWGKNEMTKIGVSKIEIYKSTNSYATFTVFGDTQNGLLATSTSYHSGVYTYTGNPGTSYYAVVTVYASNSSGTDTRTITTSTVTAPN